MKDLIGRNIYAYLMSYWEDLDDHLGRLELNALNLDYVGVGHLDGVSRVNQQPKQKVLFTCVVYTQNRSKMGRWSRAMEHEEKV